MVGRLRGRRGGKHREAEQWLELRSKFLNQNTTASAPELARLTGSQTSNPSAHAHDWLKAGRIFSINSGTEERFPLFQLFEGKPIRELADVLEILRPRLSEWQIAVWFTAPNAWTGNWRTPAELLASEPMRVMEAAHHEMAEQVL